MAFKRKLFMVQALSDPHASASKRKRLFRQNNNATKTPELAWFTPQEREMSELLDFILTHEEAFQHQGRLTSLYADFRQQLDVNPDGYYANISFWTKALTDAARAGKIPTQGSTHDLLNIRTGEELLRALQHPHYGKPSCLPAVFREAVRKREFIPTKDFLNSKTNIYRTSWLPSAWTIMQWGLQKVGVLGQPNDSKLEAGNFVVLKNVEVATDEILKRMKEARSTADRVLSKQDFSKRFSNVLDTVSPLTSDDLHIILTYLARDKQAISYSAQTIKFKSGSELVPLPITQEDIAIAELRDTLAKINAQIPPLAEKIALADAAAREAVKAKQMVRAKAALRSKKLAETALAQRSDVALQLEGVYNQLQQAADQVGIVEAMKAGAVALQGLHEQVGGAEGVQGVVDAVQEQMAKTDEISNIMNESAQPVDEMEIDDEFEALEKAEHAKREQEEAAKTAARFAELEQAERARKEKEEEDAKTEEKVEEAEKDLSKLSFVQQDESDKGEPEEETRVPVPV